MPIYQLVQQQDLPPEMTPILIRAFDTAWDEFKSSGSPLAEDACAAATRTLLAKRIIETAQKGEMEAHLLVKDGLNYLSELN